MFRSSSSSGGSPRPQFGRFRRAHNITTDAREDHSARVSSISTAGAHVEWRRACTMGTRRWLSIMTNALGLRAGDWVRVRSAEEILGTLDERGCLDNLPFMPEMLKACGQRFQVAGIAHKTCDTATLKGGRRMRNAVFLENMRCDGASHGGCQARCLMFWK